MLNNNSNSIRQVQGVKSLQPMTRPSLLHNGINGQQGGTNAKGTPPRPRPGSKEYVPPGTKRPAPQESVPPGTPAPRPRPGSTSAARLGGGAKPRTAPAARPGTTRVDAMSQAVNALRKQKG